jgi:hypothetical protein
MLLGKRTNDRAEPAEELRAFLREQMLLGAPAADAVAATDATGSVVAHRHVQPVVTDATDEDDDSSAREYVSLAAAVDRGLEREQVATHKRKREVAVAAAVEPAAAVVSRPRKRPRFEHECFMCAYGNSEYDGDPDAGCQPYVELVNMIRTCYGTMSNDELSVKLSNYYYAHIYDPAAEAAPDGRAGLPEMPPHKFKAHIERGHTLNPVIMIGETVRYVYDAIILNRTEHAQSDRAVDKLTRLATTLRTMLTMPRQTYFGAHMHGEQLAMDPAALGDAASLRRVRPLLVRDQTTLGGAPAADTSAAATARRRVFDLGPAAAPPSSPSPSPERGSGGEDEYY